MLKDQINLDSKATRDFLTYANAVIKSRAIANVEDNLKPVHRRILHTMGENKLWHNKKTVKSSNIVGKVMIYHPHGDTSIYDSIVRLSQPWKMRYPLIDMQGNNGSILGDNAAASRYTEVRLTKFGELMLEGIEKKPVLFKPNYDETTEEPCYLPSVFPNVLCNGNAGIAVGLSSSLVPHNLKEVVNGINAYLDSKAITTEQLMRFIPGPDFPTGGTITNSDKIREIYETGNGTLTLRSKYSIEEVNSVNHIVIHEVPYQVNVETGVIEPIKKLVIEEGFDLIDDIENNTSKNKFEIRIILSKGANVYKVLETLWSKTRLEITQRINNNVLFKGEPILASLKDLIAHYVRHRHNMITHIADYDLEKAEARLLVVNALLTALDKIDEVIELIKNSKDRNTAKKELMTFLEINEEQASAILSMRLSQLNKLDSIELKDEKESLQKKKEDLNEIIGSERRREQIMKKQLLTLANQYGDERKTTLSNSGSDAAEGFPIEPLTILFYENGSILPTQKEFKDLDITRKSSKLNDHGIVAQFDTQTDKDIAIFGRNGSIYRRKVLTMNMENKEEGVLPTKPVGVFDLDEIKDYFVFVTSAGIVKKTKSDEYLKSKDGSRAIRLKGDQDLIYVGTANDDDYIAVLNDKLAFFKVEKITHTGKVTIGSKGISGGNVTSATVVSKKDKLLIMNKEGKGKLTKVTDLVETSKGGNGQVVGDSPALVTKAGKAPFFVYDGSKNHIIKRNPATKSKTAVGSKVISGEPFFIAANN